MSDTDRVIFPDEVDDIKETAKAEVKVEGGDSNTVEQSPAMPSVTMRNMITVPGNCPPGHQMGADGVCREVFD